MWLALSDRGALVLTVFEGRQQTGGGTGVFTGGDPRVRGAVNSLRVGDNAPPRRGRREDRGERPGALVRTELQLQRRLRAVRPGAAQAAILDPATLTPDADLKSEKLLRDQPIGGRPHKALGYDVGELPGFALPPPALTDLRILHGSCRRPGFVYPDDDEGEELRRPRLGRRPHPGMAARHRDAARVRSERPSAPALLHRRPDLRGRRLVAAAPDAEQGGQPADQRQPSCFRRGTRRRKTTRAARRTSTRRSRRATRPCSSSWTI